MYEHLINQPELARVVADITGDGHLQIQEWRHLVSFYSKEIEEIERVKERFSRLFEVEGRIYIDDSASKISPKPIRRYKLFIISKSVASFLRDVGTPVGNKTNQQFSVPSWIFEGNAEIRSAYLRGLFDNEGSIFCRNTLKPRWQIGFKMVKNENIIDHGITYLNQIRHLLARFQIHCSPVRRHKLNIRKDGSQSIELMFNIEKISFRNFLKHVGFENKDKQKKLLESLRPSPSG